ncbi:MAG: hypothetical protein LBT83_04705 [Tannerella sp.]|jgi:hypothetical protein|nr:hypothetical protein [Tannerella sp.]
MRKIKNQPVTETGGVGHTNCRRSYNTALQVSGAADLLFFFAVASE